MKSRKKILRGIIPFLLILSNYALSQGNEGALSNPFFTVSKLPFQTPDFDKIKLSDIKPALEEGMKIQNAEIFAIANNMTEPTFENTLVTIEKSGQLYNRVIAVYYLYYIAKISRGMDSIINEEDPKVQAHMDDFYLNSKLFKRIEILYKKRYSLALDSESLRLIEYFYQQFVMAGAMLSDSEKTKLMFLNQEEATLGARMTSKLHAASTNAALILTDTSALSGLTPNTLSALAENARLNKFPGKWMIELQSTTQQPLLQSLENRGTRQALFQASWNRTEKGDSNDTRQIISRFAQLRAEKARLLGYPNYATWKLQDQMAKTPANVEAFYAKQIPAITAKAKMEALQIQEQIVKNNADFKLQPFDWNYYAEQIRKEKFNLDDDEVRPYFEVNRVLEKGVFYAAYLLYGLSFKERHDLPVYQSNVRVFEVFDKDRTSIALFYFDYFQRDDKAGGATTNNLVMQSMLLGTKPVVYNICNFTKPAPGKPALIGLEEVTTMFHEFGHGLHGIFAKQRYYHLAGAFTARDFVEFPSQFNEHWAMDSTVLKNYTMNSRGDRMPASLVNKIRNASGFNQGFKLAEAAEAAELDQKWHEISADSLQNPDLFEQTELHKMNLDLTEIPPRYRSSYFAHIWIWGYDARYYAYAWTKMLAENAVDWFNAHGGLTRANGQRFRDMILSRGNTIEYGKMFRDFCGHDASIIPYLKYYDLPTQ